MPEDTSKCGIFYSYGAAYNDRSTSDLLINRGLNSFRCGLNTARWEGVLGQDVHLKHWVCFQRAAFSWNTGHWGEWFSCHLESVRTRDLQWVLNSSPPNYLCSFGPEQSSAREKVVVVFLKFLSPKEVFKAAHFMVWGWRFEETDV